VSVAELRAAWWARRALPRVRRQLRAGHLRDVKVAAPPPLPAEAERGVNAVLRRLPSSCLERAIVLQRWHAGHGRPVDVIVGVTAPGDFRAHAWLEYEPAPALPVFNELFRLAP
jgi:transglutaminase superfamily protein